MHMDAGDDPGYPSIVVNLRDELAERANKEPHGSDTDRADEQDRRQRRTLGEFAYHTSSLTVLDFRSDRDARSHALYKCGFAAGGGM